MSAHDLIIRNGLVIDGTGIPGYVADVAIDNDRIAAIGKLTSATAERTIDATKRIVSPGFIDAHTHDDRMLRDFGDMTPKVSQGVTTVVAGNCGISLAPLVATERPMEPLDLLGLREDYRYPDFRAFVDELSRHPPACNSALLVGHGTLRLSTMADVARPGTSDEIAAMKIQVSEAMESGAIGLSSGLEYPPARFSETNELIELASAAAAAGGIYATHMRDYGDRAREAFDEAVEVGNSAGLPVVISHFHCHSPDKAGLCSEALDWYDDSRAAGAELIADAYPYEASSTSILPRFVERKVRTFITWSGPHPEMNGTWLADIAAQWDVDEMTAAERLAPGGAIYFGRDEANVQRLMQHPDIIIGSDGIPLTPHPHPRLWGTFPRFLGHYARDLSLVSFENAIRRMTSVPAARFGLTDRGVLEPGAMADMTIFDPLTIIDRATYTDPEKAAAGIDHVFVNGTEVWNRAGHTGARPGRVAGRRNAKQH